MSGNVSQWVVRWARTSRTRRCRRTKERPETMLYVNEKLLDTRPSPNNEFIDVVEDYHKTLKEQTEYFGNLIHVETKIRPYRDGAGTIRFPGPRGLLKRTMAEIPQEDGNTSMVELIYSPTVLREEDGRLKLDDPDILVNRAELSIDVQRNPDLAYFVFKSRMVGRTPAEGKKFHIKDVKKMHDNTAERRKLEGSVLNLIYSALPEDKLRTLAKSFGVSGVNLKTANTIRHELYDLLEKGEEAKSRHPGTHARGFREFIDSSEVRFHDQIAALCRDAEEKGSLVFDDMDRRWLIDYKDGGTPYVLKEMAGDEFSDPLGSLVSFLISEPNKLRKVENVMGITKLTEDEKRDEDVPKKEPVKVTPQETEKSDITAEMILKETNTPRLRSWLKKLDPESSPKPTLTAQELKMRLLPLVTPKPENLE